MALETLLIKVKTALLSHRFDSSSSSSSSSKSNPKLLLLKKSTSFKSRKTVGVLAFEIAGIMSKLLHLWHSLSDHNIIRLRNDAVSLEGVRKIISNDESFLLSLACAEFTHNLSLLADAVARISRRCDDGNLRSFDRILREFSDSGHDTHGWVISNPKEIEAKHKKMERYVTISATLYREIDELSVLEKKSKSHSNNNTNNENEKFFELQQKIVWQKQEVKDLKDKSLWNRSFDSVVSLLVRSIFTILGRIKLVFGIGHYYNYNYSIPCLSSSASAVYPSDQNPNELKPDSETPGFFESNRNLLNPPETTLGAAALALHYANLIIVMEKMIKSPQLVGVDARDDLYAMLPFSVRSSLRRRLKGVGFSASDAVLAGEWREALGRILGWLSPLAHNMIKWQSERSFEQQSLMMRTMKTNNNVLLLQTLFFANKEKTEAAITELLVGLNYIWRFEREMTAKALFECATTNFSGGMSKQKNLC